MNKRKFVDILSEKTMQAICYFVLLLIFLIVFGLLTKSFSILKSISIFKIIFSARWNPMQGYFGLAGFIFGSLWVTAIAIIISFPLSIFTAIYISLYAKKNIKDLLRMFIDLLAGISPVIYGVWGVLAVVPVVRDYLMPFLSESFHFFPFASDNYTGYSALSAGIVLAITISPIIIFVVEGVIRSIPLELREASKALGATKWQTVKYVVLRKASPGIVAAGILGLSRAYGATMAVLMVAGCSLHQSLNSIFDPAYPMPALIANAYGEMMSIPLYDSAIMLVALILLLITLFFNYLGWKILLAAERKTR